MPASTTSRRRLARTSPGAVPDGVDIYFENVGGDVLDAVAPLLNVGARIPLCGHISQYNVSQPRGFRNVAALLDKSAMIQGFRIGTHLERRDLALEVLMQWHREGRLRWRETVADGLEQAPAALRSMLTGGNVGKQVVRLAAARTA